MADSQTSSAGPRISRYRSQRRAQQQTQESTPPILDAPADEKADEGLARSRSRYHRKDANGRPTTARHATARDQEHIIVGQGREIREESLSQDESKSLPSRYASRRGHARRASPPAQAGAHDTPLVDDAYGTPVRRSLEHDPHRTPSITSPQGNSPLTQTPSGELFPPLRPKPAQASSKPILRDGPPQSSEIKATKSVSEFPVYDDGDSSGGSCFGLFKRKRGDATEQTPIARPTAANNGARARKAGGGGVAGREIPQSAVNASDRRVVVRFGDIERPFTITPSTTPVDVINSAATVFATRVSVKSAVMLEHFKTAGVQRPLRRYERIRDVVNSWDNDRENCLLLVDPGTGTSEVELSTTGVPATKPKKPQDWLLFYSQRPGKWEKRFIILHPSGQITQQKDLSKPQSQENVAHLSDFDIYTPTETKMKKLIKPPKRFCYAIKSQQRSMMFESTQNFVHFLCTSDKATADSFYTAVQGWRSWYLVNIMGEGEKTQGHPTGFVEPSAVRGTRDVAREAANDSQKAVGSNDPEHRLGSFRPLTDAAEFENGRPLRSQRSTEHAMRPASSGAGKLPARQLSSARRGNQHPPIVTSKREQLADHEPLANLAKQRSADRSVDHARGDSDDFAKDGLLGRSYTHRGTEHAERERTQDQAYPTGRNLLNPVHDLRPSSQDSLRRTVSTRAARDTNYNHKPNPNLTTDLRRNASTRKPPISSITADLQRSGSKRLAPEKPLIDLTPETYEPPQHSMKGKGKGYRPTQVGPGGLIASVPSPEDPLGVPPSTDWRARSGKSRSPAGGGGGGGGSSSGYIADTTIRAREDLRLGGGGSPLLSQHHHYQQQQQQHSPDLGAGPFTGEGLLAGSQASQGWGGETRGRGVLDGSRARNGPLVALEEPSQFVEGSLLRLAERERER